jgi:hypothetical protein
MEYREASYALTEEMKERLRKKKEFLLNGELNFH